MAKTKVTYRGFSDVRTFSAKELRDAGVEGDAAVKLEFHRRGAKRTQEIEMSEKLLEVLKNDGGFDVEEGGVSGSAETETEPETVVNADTGQVDKRK